MIWNSSKKVSDVVVSNEVCSIENIMRLLICLFLFLFLQELHGPFN